ncbi:ferritin-like domain-containing protein [Microbacterium sp. YY-03]|uniref:YciE/YciF ferroxidase family protein n=1 Tax=Microbacterium sp. YY-03 TaxID=3421636 RepID=UPI003D17D399
MSQLQLETPEDLLRYQLRSARTMEDDSLAALGELASAAQSSEVEKLFRHHADETKEQIANLSKVFELLELPESTAPSPSTKGISKQAASLIEKSASGLLDQVTLSCALGNEHYEMSMYQGLIVATKSLHPEAAQLLQDNLDQEVHTSEELLNKLKEMSA